jgi:hypothetical protein
MVVGVAEGGAGFNKEEHLQNLKHCLDQRLRGNRAPLLINAHSLFYAAQPVGRDFKPPNITSQEMRQVIAQFLAYALSQPEVRIVPYRNILAWRQHPSPLNNPVSVTHSGPPQRRNNSISKANEACCT